MLKRPVGIDPLADNVLRINIINEKHSEVQKEMTQFHYNYLTKIYEQFAKHRGKIESTVSFCEKIGFQRSMWYHIGITYYGTNAKFRQVLRWAYYAETHPEEISRMNLPPEPPTVGDPNNPEWEPSTYEEED